MPESWPEKPRMKGGVLWSEALVAGGVAAVSAAVTAGLGVSAFARRMQPLGAKDVGSELGLPYLLSLPVLLHSRAVEGKPRDAVAALAGAFLGQYGNSTCKGLKIVLDRLFAVTSIKGCLTL
jgi:hypothetical protein